MRTDELKDNGKPASREAKTHKAVVRLGVDMERAAYGWDGIITLRVRGPREVGDELLCVVRRENEEGLPEVAFQSGESLQGVLIGLSNRMANGTIRWMPDKYAEGSQDS